MQILYIFLLVIILLSTACSSVNKFDAAVADKFASLKKPEVPPFDKLTAIKLYSQLLEKNIIKQRPEYKNLISRLAQLQLSAGEEGVASVSERTVQRSRDFLNSSINLFRQYLTLYPNEPSNDKIYYLLAKANILLGKPNRASDLLGRIIKYFPKSPLVVEALFRRGELLSATGKYHEAENEYQSIINKDIDVYFYDMALHKLGWTQFKQRKFDVALQSYIKLLKFKVSVGQISFTSSMDNQSAKQKNLMRDIVASLALIYLYKGDALVNQNELANLAKQAYGPVLFREVSNIYIKKNMLQSAGQILLDFSNSNRSHPSAIRFHAESIELLEKSTNSIAVANAKADFVKFYGVGSTYWEKLDVTKRQKMLPTQVRYVSQLAQFFHKRANDHKYREDYRRAIEWYSRYITSFPSRHDVAQMQFLLAEVLFVGEFFQRAIIEYEKAAYIYPVNKNSAEAGYAALLSYQKVIEKSEKNQQQKWQEALVGSALKFTEKYYYDKRVPSVLIKTAQSLYSMKRFKQAANVANTLITRKKLDNKQQKIVAWNIYAHAHYDLGMYDVAESDYSFLLSMLSRDHKLYKEVAGRIVNSVYKQGEIYRNEGNYQFAAAEFMRVADITDDPITKAAAEYDAAAMYLRLEDWNRAIVILKVFQDRHPSRKDLIKKAKEKLIFAYSKTGQHIKVAEKLIQESSSNNNKIHQRDLLWEASVRFDKGGEFAQAAESYKDYVWKYPLPLEKSMEARLYLVEYYQKVRDTEKSEFWLKQIIKKDRNAGRHRTARSRYLAATAALHFANESYKKYQAIELKEPLKTSMKMKKNQMKETLIAFQKAMGYNVEDVYITATYQIAELYGDFARSIMTAKKPAGLSKLELEQYEILLEEKAYPLEEKAIDIHKENLRYTKDGVFNDGVKKSLQKLGKLEPYRFNKTEMVMPYVDAAY